MVSLRSSPRAWRPAYALVPMAIVALFLLLSKTSGLLVRQDLLARFNIDSFARERTYYFPFSSRFAMPRYSYKHLDDGQGVPDSGRALEEHIMHYNLNYLSRDDIVNSNKVLVLSVIDTFNENFWQNLLRLSFDRQNIELGFMVLPTAQGNDALQTLERRIKETQMRTDQPVFKHVTILRASEPPAFDTDGVDSEVEKRRYFAGLKNELVSTTLGPETRYILWLDQDIVETPATVIEDMISVGKPVVAANIQTRGAENKGTASYQYENAKSWIENEHWRLVQNSYADNYIFMEGIGGVDTKRVHINDLATVDPAQGVKLDAVVVDSVSFACTLVLSDVHRDGAMFPNFPFHHRIDTEGFSKMAQRLNYELSGMPNYFVYHS